MGEKKFDLMISVGLNIETKNLIGNIEDKSSDGFIRMLILLKNGLKLSVISGPYAYCDHENPYEIACIGKNGEWLQKYYDEGDNGDDVIGHCDKNKVIYYINKIGGIKC